MTAPSTCAALSADAGTPEVIIFPRTIITLGNPETRYFPTSRKQKFKIIPLIMNNHGKFDRVKMYNYSICEHSQNRVWT
jgi:hypothetical protein